MKHIQLFENFINRDEILTEASQMVGPQKLVLNPGPLGTKKYNLSKMPVINFDKLPKKEMENMHFKDQLYAAGFPKTENPLIDDINFQRYYKKVAGEESGDWWYVRREKAPTPNYILKMPPAKGFEKFPCIIDQYYKNDQFSGEISLEGTGNAGSGGDNYLNPNPVANFLIYRPKEGGNSKVYYPDGTVELYLGWDSATGMPSKKSTKTTYSCQDNNLIDKFIKNPTGKTYTGNNPWVKSSSGDKGKDFIPWFSKDPVGSDWIAKIQKYLIDNKYLSIPKPTGFLGNQTKNALLAWGQDAQNVNVKTDIDQNEGFYRKTYEIMFKGSKQ